ncbi:MAG: universal stress protein [Vicinamibacterales bacterium]
MTKPFRHILCPIDFSAHSRAALRYAADLAQRGGSRLTALFVNDPLLDAAAAASAYDMQLLAAETRKQMRRFIQRAGLDADTPVVIESGHAAQAIRQSAARVKADLIVMGSHGLSGARKWLLGSTTEHVLRSSRVPVLVIPPRLANANVKKRPARVLVAVDLADYGAEDIRAVRQVLSVFDATAIFLHVMQPVRQPSWFPAADTGTVESDRARTALVKLAHRVGAGTRCQLVVGDPADEIAAAAASGRAGLILLKLRRPSTVFGARRGSITYRVAGQAAAPVLALPEGWIR